MKGAWLSGRLEAARAPAGRPGRLTWALSMRSLFHRFLRTDRRFTNSATSFFTGYSFPSAAAAAAGAAAGLPAGGAWGEGCCAGGGCLPPPDAAAAAAISSSKTECSSERRLRLRSSLEGLLCADSFFCSLGGGGSVRCRSPCFCDDSDTELLAIPGDFTEPLVDAAGDLKLLVWDADGLVP